MEPTSTPSLAADTTRLCLACGLCCQGVLFGSVRLNESDVAIAEGLALPIVQERGQPAVEQPCACFSGDRCSIYDTRFSRCRDYACMLLQRVEEGSETLDGALAVVKRTHAAAATLRGLLGEARSTMQIWHAIGDYIRAAKAAGTLDDVRQHAAVFLNMRVLSLLSHRYFDRRVQDEWNRNDLPLTATNA